MDYINKLMETETQSTGGTEEMGNIVRFHQLGGPEVLKVEEVPAQEAEKDGTHGETKAGSSNF